MQSLMMWIAEECGNYRQRIYDPLQTLTLFIEQVLGADHSCQDAVARGLSGRVSLGQTPCSLNTAAYSKAIRPRTAKRAHACPWVSLNVWGEKRAGCYVPNNHGGGFGADGK